MKMLDAVPGPSHKYNSQFKKRSLPRQFIFSAFTAQRENSFHTHEIGAGSNLVFGGAQKATPPYIHIKHSVGESVQIA